MSLAVLKSRALNGMDAPQVTVEVHLANGLPAFTIVGLPETEVKESKDRVRAALQNARFEFPAKESLSIWRRQICQKNPAVSICLSPLAYWPHPDRYPQMHSHNTNSLASYHCRVNYGPSVAHWR
jgi:hypothetical protein